VMVLVVFLMPRGIAGLFDWTKGIERDAGRGKATEHAA